jgi:alpha-amylase
LRSAEAESCTYSNGDGRTLLLSVNGGWDREVLVECRFDLFKISCDENSFNPDFHAKVSPPNENIIISGRPWWERYQPVSYMLSSRSGSEADFQNMATRCNAVGVRIYVDVLINHMTGDHDNIVGTGGSTANTVQRNFPAVPWTPADFNTRCTIVNWNDPAEVRNCELYGLHDLNQGLAAVRNRIIAYLDRLVDLGVAGFRIDAARHMWPADLAFIYGQVKNLNIPTFLPNTRPFTYQEIWHDNQGPSA